MSLKTQTGLELKRSKIRFLFQILVFVGQDSCFGKFNRIPALVSFDQFFVNSGKISQPRSV